MTFLKFFFYDQHLFLQLYKYINILSALISCFVNPVCQEWCWYFYGILLLKFRQSAKKWWCNEMMIMKYSISASINAILLMLCYAIRIVIRYMRWSFPACVGAVFPSFSATRGIEGGFWPFLKKIAAKLAVKLEFH